MGGTLTPYAIALGGVAAVALIFSSAWRGIAPRLATIGSSFARDLDVAGMPTKPEELGFGLLAIAAVGWIALVIVFRPTPLVGGLFLPMVLGLSLYGTKTYVRMRVRRRIAAFQNELENVLRMLAGGIRVGLGLRQALVHVAEQSREPARHELMRVVGVSNLGVSVLDALDELGRRIPTTEAQMMARVIRVQSQSGGDLAGVLDGLASTIRDRRRFDRKVRALTSQGRATAWILGILPVGVGAFVLGTQPLMRTASLTTGVGHAMLALGLGLDIAAIVVLQKMTKLDV